MSIKETTGGRQVQFPNLLDATFEVADRIAPAMDRIRRSSSEGELRRFDPTLVVSGAFLFAGYLLTKFCEEFVKALGSAFAKTLVDRIFDKPKQASETSLVLEELAEEMKRLRLSCNSPRELQTAINQAIGSVHVSLVAHGIGDGDARIIASGLADTFAAKIQI